METYATLYGYVHHCQNCGKEYFGVFTQADPDPALQRVYQDSPFYGDGSASHCPACGSQDVTVDYTAVLI